MPPHDDQQKGLPFAYVAAAFVANPQSRSELTRRPKQGSAAAMPKP